MTGGRRMLRHRHDRRAPRRRLNRRGLTLMEMIVVVAVLSITIVVAIDIFLNLSKLQRRASAQQEVQSDARYLLEAVVRDVRSGTVDYAFYGGSITNPETILVVRDPDGNQRQYQYEPGAQKIRFCMCNLSSPTSCPDPGDLLVPGCIDDTDTPTWQDVTPPGITIQSAVFTIIPMEDPFDLTTGVDEQPQVTISLGSTSPQLGGETLFLQTTASSRAYQR
ncbi:MAG: prepilin-type N-terminal cleavage/methylation domain-containing protein [Candidatus Kerfeldbacteria bacterium]|nr:prepilin-type N-terminal cleavage/methylation domain-containing protein [Candidatus Kerfeldbacteria bacterium]